MKLIEQVNVRPESASIADLRKAAENTMDNFYALNGIRCLIAISGGADNQGEAVTAIISELFKDLKDTRIGILSGGTEGGVPEIATKLAREFSFPTVGVFPRDGRKYALPELDFAIEALPPLYGKAGFGTETPTFIAIANGMAVIGGEFGTLAEVASVLKSNKSRLKKGEEPVYLCPIRGLGGVAELFETFPGIAQMFSALPAAPVYSGRAAASFFRDKLGL